MPSFLDIALLSALFVSCGAAISDLRSGMIPNWLTLPPVVVAPIAYGVFLGWQHAALSVAAAALSGVVPYLLFRMRAMGGGDVKLFAALGAITGFDLLIGLEIQLVAFVTAMIFVTCALAWRKCLRTTLRRILVSIVSVASVGRSELRTEGASPTPVRLGSAILVATGLELYANWSAL